MVQPHESIYFLHGLESSGNGTKGKYFAQHFPIIKCPDFQGSLAKRLNTLSLLTGDDKELIFIGSSYGGLMASCFSRENRERIQRLILLAPALNFEGYTPPAHPIDVPVLLVIGRHDNVTPVNPVLQLAKKSFSGLTTWICEDDHMLHKTFYQIDWQKLLSPAVILSNVVPPAGVVALVEE